MALGHISPFNTKIIWRHLMDNSVILITPADQSHAYEAQSRIRELSSKGAIDLFGQAVVETDDNGTPTIKDSDEPALGIGTITGGLLGSVVGILGGPAGVLLGFSAGTAAGAMGDVVTSADAFDALTQISAKLKPQATALVVADARRAAREAKTQEVKTKLAEGWANFTAKFDAERPGHMA
jgi:uncharacterized membrane protein